MKIADGFSLIHFTPLNPFYTSWKDQKTSGIDTAQFPADLVTVTEESLMENFIFCAERDGE